MSQKMNSKNLPKTYSVKRRPDLLFVTVSLSELCKMPTKKQIVGRYLELFGSEKSRVTKIKMIAEELTNLWKFLNFSIVHTCKSSLKQEVLLIFIKNIEKENRSK